MPFLGHIDELRKRLTIIISVLLPCVIAGYFFATPIYNFLVAPLSGILGDEPAVTLKLLEGMGIRFKLGLWGGLMVGSPIIIYELFAFFMPALKEKERKWFTWTFIAAVLLFIGGAAFCYLIILGPSASWLSGQNGDLFQYIPTGADLVQVSMYFLLGFGIAFEVPIVVFYLVYFGVIPYDKLAKNWRVVWVAIVIIAAMITPDWSPVSMGALALAMIGLFQGTLILLRVLLRHKIAAQRAEWDEED